jgi:hypothetical protein
MDLATLQARLQMYLDAERQLLQSGAQRYVVAPGDGSRRELEGLPLADIQAEIRRLSSAVQALTVRRGPVYVNLG